MKAFLQILLLNLAIFGATATLEEDKLYLNNVLALFPLSSEYFNFYQIVTHIFAHIDLTHVLANMFVFVLFAPFVEGKMSKGEFWKFYLFVGIVSSLLFRLSTDFVLLGASGAVFGVTGAFLALSINEIRKKSSYIGLHIMGIGFISTSVILEVRDLFFINDDVAHSVHLIGFAFGIIYVWYYKLRKSNVKS